MDKDRTVLIVTSHYPPNIGGVESHLQALVSSLMRRKWRVIISTYQPLASSKTVPFKEEKDRLTIYRFPWISFNIFHWLAPYPALEFIFLFPGLFLITLITLIGHPKIGVIHCQGLVPSAVGAFMKIIFRRRMIASTHNLYFFPKKGLYPFFARWFFSVSDKILTPTYFARRELLKIGVPARKVSIFRYWIDLKNFRPLNKEKARRILGWNKKSILFVGRLIETKGVDIILNLAKKIKSINFYILGNGPLKDKVIKETEIHKNLHFLGSVENNKLNTYYAAADITLVPSLVDEGFGFVVMESSACGTPVIASKKGGLDEAVDSSIGILVRPNLEDFDKNITYLFENQDLLKRLTKNTRKFAQSNFGEQNIKVIINSYER